MRSDKVARREDLPPMPEYGPHLRHCLETGRERIAGRLPAESRLTRSQSWRRGRHAGRRQTNDRKHRKGYPTYIADRVGIPEGRAFVRWAKSDTAREENGDAHLAAGRCKRRRHVWTVSSSNWGDPERSCGWVPQVVGSIRRKAEVCGDAGSGVGDGHSSEDGRDNTTRLERRAISLRVLSKECGDPA